MKTIIANWKMNLGIRESAALARATLLLLRGRKQIPHMVLCPSFTALAEVHKVIARSSVSLGAQNVSWEEQGALTGEISVRMLTEVGVNHMMVGHSERRSHFGETDETVRQKIAILLKHTCVPIVCVGETKEERDRGEATSHVKHQLFSAFRQARLGSSDRLMIAYEPVWAIGTGITPSVEEVVEMHKAIRACLEELLPSKSERIDILYGGSVNGKDVYHFLREPSIDGVLVGGASTKIHELKDIVDAACEVLEAQGN